MRKIKHTLLFSCLAFSVITPLTTLASKNVTEEEIGKVIPVLQNTRFGYLSIANNRNCMVADDQAGEKSPAKLKACPKHPQFKVKAEFYYTLELKEGLCLADMGDSNPVLTYCNSRDKRQRWTGNSKIPTEVRNIATQKCLTAKGLNNPLGLEACNGSYTQSWIFPK